MTTGDTDATCRDALVARTMLDMITWLERTRDAFATLVLGGDFADRDIAAFVREAYPSIAVVVLGTRDTAPAVAAACV